ncbi:hypothetical protein [Streptomyces ureilyticus]|uniref:DUF3558 domain-containing protein n=1 Tax=Streptomyces ureilyticus TaxID=1775131 RepID=A0ABX0DV13_9ACTN|nr:hypothetical protein [Streptomyces ureilyticus]NGO45760.1 hypothetical protein [Streptomyces ureilyticus]
MPVVLATVGGYSWYQLSDTGRRWRYEDKLESYCGGVLPYEETVAFTGLPSDPDTGLPHDVRHGTPERGREFCWIGHLDIFVTAARIPTDSSELKSALPPEQAKALPTPLGGGWRGFTDGMNTSVVLPCSKGDSTIAVTAVRSNRLAKASENRKMAELVTATAAEAADRWGCESRLGTRVPAIALATDFEAPHEAKGTCAGLPLAQNKRIDKVKEAPADGLSPFEVCQLEEKETEDGYYLEASFGPYAQRERAEGWNDEVIAKPAGGGGKDTWEFFWASAECSGDGSRALFQILAKTATTENPSFARAALVAFAKRAAEQRDCTDLQLPPAP